MPKKDVDQIINGLDDKIVDIVGQFVKRRRDSYEKAAKQLKESLRADVKRYAELLENDKISGEDFEHLVRGRSAQLKIEVLAEASINKSKFDLVSNQLVGVLIKSSIDIIKSA